MLDVESNRLVGGALVAALGNGDGTFGAPQTIPTPTPISGPVVVADFNRDGSADIVAIEIVTHEDPAPQLWILGGRDDGTFEPARVLARYERLAHSGTPPNTGITADFDGDSILDFAIALDPNTLHVYAGNSDLTFAPAAALPTSARPYGSRRAAYCGAIEPHLAGAGPVAPAPQIQARVHEAVVTAYNATVRLPEVRRPQRLLDTASALVGPGADVDAYVARILSACCRSFERFDPSSRFCPPDFASRRTLGFGYLSWVARPAREERVDLWVSAHHVGLDGVPLQDLIGRLERAWGQETVLFPGAGTAAFHGPHACHAPGERAVDHLCGFVDLTPLMELRRRLAHQHRASIGGEVTVGALIAWLLSQEPEFKGVRIASTVDVKESGGYDRDVDVVPHPQQSA